MFSNRFTKIWIVYTSIQILVFHDYPFWCVLLIFMSHFEVFFIVMWVHKMCSVNKFIHIYCIVSLSQIATVNETSEKNQSSSNILQVIWLKGFYMYWSFNKNWSCTSFRKLCYTWLYPPGRELCQHSNLIFHVQILSGMVSKFKYFRFLEFIMTLSGE